MADDTPLSEAERRELEELRAQKAAREAREQAQRERAELERLRAEQRQSESKANRRHDRNGNERLSRREYEARQRGRKLMEPGDDLSMPMGQKIVLIAIALIVAGIIVTILLSPK